MKIKKLILCLYVMTTIGVYSSLTVFQDEPIVEQPQIEATDITTAEKVPAAPEEPNPEPVVQPENVRPNSHEGATSRGGTRLVREHSEDEDFTKLYFELTTEDREMLARLVKLEAGGESDKTQRGVTSVVLNRLHSGYWGNKLHGVIYAPGQFTPAKQIVHTTPSQKHYDNVDYVLQHGTTLPSYVLYFRASYHFSWRGYKPYIHYKGDNTYFGYMIKDM